MFWNTEKAPLLLVNQFEVVFNTLDSTWAVIGWFFACGGYGKKSLGSYVCASDYSVNKNLALALEFSILHLVLSCMIIPVSGMGDVFSYFLHVLSFPCLSLSLKEVNITEWGLMTARIHRKRVNVLNYSIISCLYIKKGLAYM